MKTLFKCLYWVIKSPILREIAIDLIDNGKLDGSYRPEYTTHQYIND